MFINENMGFFTAKEFQDLKDFNQTVDNTLVAKN